MECSIIGWYGTETIGDRAILAGIIQILYPLGFDKFHVGSLYPFFTQKTIDEDIDFIKEITSNDIEIDLFDIRGNLYNAKELINSSLVLMGGGPIMELLELKYIHKVFRLARKNNIKTMLFGVGLTNLKNKQFKRLFQRTVNVSDSIIFRDESSYNLFKCYYSYNREYNWICDPAIFPCYAINISQIEKKDYVLINLRDFEIGDINVNYFVDFISFLSKYYKQIILYPNHTFKIGGDDRYFISLVKHLINSEKVSIVLQPLNLKNTLYLIAASKKCFGMRYHSILMQTICNGDNYILDYTDQKNGKIKAFLNQIDKNNFYENRYINLNNKESINDYKKWNDLQIDKKYVINIDIIKYINEYQLTIKRLLKI